MATFTMTLQDVMETVFNDSINPDDYEVEYDSFSFNGVTYGKLPVIPDAEEIGLGTYPIFNEAYRPILNGKIVDEYFNREIGMETIDVWKLALRRKMDQIMPYYNQLYASEAIEFDPISTMNIRSISHGNVQTNEQSQANASNETNSETGARTVESQTPQTMLSGNADYATGASDASSKTGSQAESSSETNNEGNTVNDSESNVTGYQGIASELLMRYRNSILNIDTMIIADIQDCFMLVLNNGDAYTRNGWYF